MEISGFLQTIAQIGVAIAGFSGLIVTLRKDAGPLTSVQKYRLQILLSMAFGAMFLSLLPDLLLSFGIPADRMWKVCSSLLALYSIVFLGWLIPATLRINEIDPDIFNWAAFSRMATGHVIVVLVQLAFLFSIFNMPATAAFATGLIWYLLHSAQQFTRMLFIRAKSDVA
jgi:hypothetical protein